MAKAKKKTVTFDEVVTAVSNGEPCPDCGAEMADPLNEKGKPIKNPPNQVMVHADDCVMREGEPK